jgi:hypothetical protein
MNAKVLDTASCVDFALANVYADHAVTLTFAALMSNQHRRTFLWALSSAVIYYSIIDIVQLAGKNITLIAGI